MARSCFAGVSCRVLLLHFSTLLWLAYPPLVSALNLSTGPNITTNTSIGPNGAMIQPVWNSSIYNLTGVDNTGTPTSIGQFEPAEPGQSHVMLTNPRIGLRTTGITGAAAVNHATMVAGIIVGLPLGNLRGVAHHNSTILYSAGGDYYDSIRNWLTLNPNRIQVMNMSAGFDWQDNEVQRFGIPNTVTGGNYTLTFNGNTTGNLPFNANAATIQTALNGLASINGGVTVTSLGAGGTFSNRYRVKFHRNLGGQNVAQMTAGNAGLMGVGNVTLQTAHQGSPTTFNNGQSAASLFADFMVQDRNFLFVKSAGNEGRWAPANSITPPGDAYNVLTVGATGVNPANLNQVGMDYTRVAPYSSRGPTTDANPRHKIELVAPGSVITSAGTPVAPGNNQTSTASGTSFAAPHVTGMAALLMDNARNSGSTSGDRRVIKATLLNSASKHVRDPLNGDRAWPQSPAAQFNVIGGEFVSRVPLDDAMGAGQLNGYAAVRQHQNQFTDGLTTHSGIIIGGVGENTYNLNGGQEIKRGGLVVATIAWDRDTKLKSGVDASNLDNFKNAANYETKYFDLDIRLTKEDGTLVAKSASFYDTVEHLYFNVREDGKYKIVVKGFTPGNGSSVRYGVAMSAGSTSGISFSVDGGFFNSARQAALTPNPAEGLYAPQSFAPYPNDVHALGVAGPGHFPTEGEIFSASPVIGNASSRNMHRLSGALGTQSRVGPHNGPPAAMAVLSNTQRGVLGLTPNDNLVGMSYGRDGTDGKKSILVFSVDPQAQGAPNTSVRFNAVDNMANGANPLLGTILPTNPLFAAATTGGGSAAGDLFKTLRLDPFGAYRSQETSPSAGSKNRLHISAETLGLQGTSDVGNLLNTLEDDLDAVELDDILDYVDNDGDGMHNKPVFFSLDTWSPSLARKNYSAADVFVSFAPDTEDTFGLQPNQAFDFEPFATHDKLGLNIGDVIDALSVSDLSLGDPGNDLLQLEPDGIGMAPLDIFGTKTTIDELLFSLAPNSFSVANVNHPTLARKLSPADILYSNLDGTYSIFANAEDLGLLATDNLNALDILSAVVPEPSTCLLLAMAQIAWWRRLRNRCA